MKDIFKELEAEVEQNVVDRKHDEIEQKNLLIANDNLIADCLSKEVFYVATNSELNVSRFTEMHDAHTIDKARCLELEVELSNLRDKIQKDNHKELVKRFSNLKNKVKSVTKDHVKPIVLAPGKYAIDVEPIPPRNRNNRAVHLDYLRHLKESVETLHEIVEEAKVERPLDRSIIYACRYTKHSQELLEYAIGTCSKDYNQRDKKKKQVTFEEQCDTSNSNTHKHVEQLNTQKTNASMPPSTGVNSCTDTSESHHRSKTKKNRISPAKNVNKMKVEEHHRTNKSHLRTTNHVDSSSSSKRIIINLNSDSVCQTFRFRNDHFGAIMGYGDYVIGESVISRVYYVEGLGHNLFSIGQFCDSDLEVVFKKHSCYVRDTNGVELIKGSRGSNLCTISVEDMMKSSLICLLSKASKSKSWLWHRRLNHLNFGTINDLARKNLVKFLRSKDETPEVVITFLKQIQVGLYKTVRYIRTDNGTEFVNKDLTEYYERVGIFHQKTVSRTLQQNGVVKRRNRTLVEAARTMLIFSKALIVFGTLCYPINDSKDLGKLQPTADIGIFVSYAPSRKGYRIYNKHTRRIMETIHVQFDELTEQMAHVQLSTGPAPSFLTLGQISSGIVPNPVPAITYVPPTNKELEILFQPMFDEYLEPSRVKRSVSPAPAVQVPVNSAGTPSSTTIDQDAPSPSHSPSSSALQSPSLHQGIAAESTLIEDNPFAPVDNNPFINVFTPEPSSKASSSGDLCSAESSYVSQTLHHLGK
ncbi:retrovirus-related pol polyprotein from transposon TNT 1-94 [Tanacetum coccineum]|uniref:Retrovirus-related pol polyprotein from transposon TNT 1-94 n=1 Tax=Tanacetum coccineum TaxID=301880 RepID=A0ABQ5C291_9ASTR